MNFEVKSIPNANGMTLKIIGILDENCELPKFDAGFKGHLTIDLEELHMINSLGVRKWMQWAQMFPKNITVSMERCSSIVVNQMNILQGFIPDGVKIVSIYVPYFCSACQHEESELTLIPKPEQWDVNAIADERACPKCKSTMELDVIKNRYFSFVKKNAA